MCYTIRVLSFLAVAAAFGTAPVSGLGGQNQPRDTAQANSAPAMIQQMAGTWGVSQRMWPGSGMQAIELPPAVARRRLIGNVILQETMELAPGSKGEPFTRIAYIDYNAVNQQLEYFSIDTRAPQMMSETTYDPDAQRRLQDQEEVILYGGSFVAPLWGEAKNAAFRYRLAIGKIQSNRQSIQLYLTPLSGERVKEFLAFEYIYTRLQ